MTTWAELAKTKQGPYRFNGVTNFEIYNAGNIPVHPFEQELRIEISNVYSIGDFFELNNLTNGSTFRVNKRLSNSDTVVIDGPNIQINHLEGLRETNRKYIQLTPGRNSFSINGASSADISFDFRFYYL